MNHVSAHHQLADLYLARSKAETLRGNHASARCHYVLSKETRKIADRQFRMEVQSLQRSAQRRVDRQRLKTALSGDEKYKGLLGWCRYKWSKCKLSWARIQNRSREKRKGKLSVLTDLVTEENEEGDDDHDDHDEEQWNVEFIDNVVIHSLPAVPRSALPS